MNPSQIIQIIASVIYILFLPGFFISFVFFGKDKIDLIERFALSFALSISIVPLLTFYTNLIGVPITKSTVILGVLSIILNAIIVLCIKYLISLLKKDQTSYRYRKRKLSISIIDQTHSLPRFKTIHIIATEGFQIGLVTYLILLLTETIKTGFVSYFFNLNILLIVVLIMGIAMVLTHHEKKKNIIPEWSWKNLLKLVEQGRELKPKQMALGKWDQNYIFLMSLGGAILVYYKTEELGYLSLVVTLITFVIIFLLSYLIFTESE